MGYPNTSYELYPVQVHSMLFYPTPTYSALLGLTRLDLFCLMVCSVPYVIL